MKRFLDKITPAFILQWEHRILLNSPLAWQFQLPRLLWFWFCITVPGLIVPLMMDLNIQRSNRDMENLILFASVLGILQFFLYGYILIQFNATKNFVSRRWWHGCVEQLVYLFAMMLCMSQLVVYHLVLDLRRATLLTENEINDEIAIFNKGRHYFMSLRDDYLYFPDDKTFLKYMSMVEESDADHYYDYTVRPMMTRYFTFDPQNMNYIDQGYTRSSKGPKLYLVNRHSFLENEFIKESFRIFHNSGRYITSEHYKPYTFQLNKKTREESLREIRDFKAVVAKYSKTNEYPYYNENTNLIFDSDQQILDKYNSNQFQENVSGRIYTYEISNVYEGIMKAKYVSWHFALQLTIVIFLIAFPVSVMFFIFKNNNLRPLLIAIITVILLGIVTGIFSLLLRMEEDLIVHVPILVFLISVFVTLSPYRTYSQWGSVFVIIGNVCFSMVPLYIYAYVFEYLRMFSEYNYNEYYTGRYYLDSNVRETIGWICFYGGIVLYMLAGTVWYKRKYEEIWAMPLSK